MTKIREADCDPVLLSGGQKLFDWIMAGGKPDRSGPLMSLRLRWAAYWFERLSSLAARRCETVQLPTKIVFILGFWRSGTTLLHQELVEATGWATPRTWQCFNPADFLLRAPPRERSTARPMDSGIIGTFTPQEDEFAALLLGEESVYRAFIDPRRFTELEGLLHQWADSNPAAPPPLSSRWETFLKSISMLSPGPILLKSPNHTFRLPWLARRFPEASFIWLTRTREDVLRSNHRMWSAMIGRYALWHAQPGLLEGFLSTALKNHDEILEWARKTMPERLTVVPFDDVIENRLPLVRRLADVLTCSGK